ncbi:hypothetical protein G1K66_02090 [Tenacibaculum finnmarkense]|uniref:DUF5713 family protein n=1 Tax=Tenacibaculum finnmarkense TaxID=2781243 RepID=UPI00187B713A|nr:DUF5713 family protein [Tenacibaculum finnmarkense]MBE7648083.1 hypothetical protein [Tenacibaculum finnmarkense genomovar ulcerans]MCD8399702.1 DUF5713 family protein [Tenacibaculum finnmarkense genomovar ulcerans]MCG8762637.1 hypothetical protein [Tenacibaculum finnmarkense]MCG8784266.1 hypothetical protein [Tenacibaculum finnmarkense]MCG8788041.1 hypothetical protein [Tenacibaculum finnmarkense]
MKVAELKNKKAQEYNFLKEMYSDNYFPDFLVDKCKDILLNFCKEIELQSVVNLEDLYKLGEKYTEEFNEIQDEFYKNESEIETVARESIMSDFENISKIYGYENADIETLAGSRDW